jgi:signal peptidase I
MGALTDLATWPFNRLARLFSGERKMRRHAVNWLEIAQSVWNHRRDCLTEAEASDLNQRREELRKAVRDRADAGKLRLEIESLEEVLRRVGGSVYPKTSLAENVEFFLVAAIVILGLRCYFLQPFTIPTNSMWPSYYGMTSQSYARKADEPSVPAEAARLVLLGAWPHRLTAPADGEILIPVGGAESRGWTHSRIVPGRTWLVLPTKVREYTLLVGDQPVTVRLPIDFDFDWTVAQSLFPPQPGNYPQNFSAFMEAQLASGNFEMREVDGEYLHCIRTGRVVRAGDRVLSFDELTGDKLFVDRISYHFVRPKVGDGFVFRTGNIPDIVREEGDQYYIKRLVGVPGDTLEVRGTTLWRNGAPITGAAAFEANSRRLGDYPGYGASGLLSPGRTVHVGPMSFFAMGDNSPNSADGRVWGFVPAKDVAGRPLFVYYPITRRWGLAH